MCVCVCRPPSDCLCNRNVFISIDERLSKQMMSWGSTRVSTRTTIKQMLHYTCPRFRGLRREWPQKNDQHWTSEGQNRLRFSPWHGPSLWKSSLQYNRRNYTTVSPGWAGLVKATYVKDAPLNNMCQWSSRNISSISTAMIIAMWLFLVTCHKLMLYYRYYSQNATNSCQLNKNNTKILFVGFKGNVGNLTEIIYTFNKSADIMWRYNCFDIIKSVYCVAWIFTETIMPNS